MACECNHPCSLRGVFIILLTQLVPSPSHSHDIVKGRFVSSAFIGDIPSKHGNNRVRTVTTAQIHK